MKRDCTGEHQFAECERAEEVRREKAIPAAVCQEGLSFPRPYNKSPLLFVPSPDCAYREILAIVSLLSMIASPYICCSIVVFTCPSLSFHMFLLIAETREDVKL